MPYVFISYSHGSDEQQRAVLELANRLRGEGVETSIDQYQQSPPTGWADWCHDEIERADFVLVLCTETYARRLDGDEVPGVGRGTTWEGAMITTEIYGSIQHGQSKFIPVVFDPHDHEYVPYFLAQVTRYDLSDEDGYLDLYRRLTGQPEVVPAPLGELQKLQPASGEPRQDPGPPGPQVQAPEVSAAPPPQSVTAALRDVIEGSWIVELHNPFGGADLLEVRMYHDPTRIAQFRIASKVGPPRQMTGQWEVLPGEQLALNGVQTVQAPWPQTGAYSVFLQFYAITQNELRATTPQAGEMVIWRRN